MSLTGAINQTHGNRYVPEIPDIVAQLAYDTRIFIYNVGPWELRRELGSPGAAIIRACPEGREYSEPFIVLGVEQEPYPFTETECSMIPKAGKLLQKGGSADGILLAHQILGEGPHLPSGLSFRPFGVFISRTEVPSKEDLSKARAALRERLQLLVKEANDSWADGRDKKEVIQKDWHQRAAEMLKKGVAECPWMGDRQTGVERIDCPFCMVAIPATVAKCPNCKEVVNQDLYKAAQARARASSN